MKVRIPKDLPLLVANNRRLKKLLDTWLVLKSWSESGNIPCTSIRDVAASLAATGHFNKCSKTIHNRISVLIKAGFIRHSEKQLELISWSEFRDKMGMQYCNRFYFVRTGQAPVEHILDAKAMSEKIDKCKEAYAMRLRANPALGHELKEISGGASPAAVYQSQLYAFKTNGMGLSSNDYAVLMDFANPNFIPGSKGWNRLFGYSGRGSSAYLKSKLQRSGLIEVVKRQMGLDLALKTTADSRRTLLGKVAYFRKENKLVLTLTDRINFLPANPCHS